MNDYFSCYRKESPSGEKSEKSIKLFPRHVTDPSLHIG